MPIIIETSSSALDINSLFDSPKGEPVVTAIDALSGKFTQSLIRTADYRLSLATFVNYQGEDGPSDGILYELELYKEDKTRRFSFAPEAVEYIQAYMANLKQVQRITFDIAKLGNNYSLRKSMVNGRQNICLDSIGVNVYEVLGLKDDTATRASGFVKTEDVLKLSAIKDDIALSLESL